MKAILLRRWCAWFIVCVALVCANGCASAAKKTAKVAVKTSVETTKASAKVAVAGAKATGQAAVGVVGAILDHDDEDEESDQE
jgi:hypothetical protein